MEEKMNDYNYDVFCGRRSYPIAVMLSKFEKTVLLELANSYDTSMSDIIRNSLKEYYCKRRNDLLEM